MLKTMEKRFTLSLIIHHVHVLQHSVGTLIELSIGKRFENIRFVFHMLSRFENTISGQFYGHTHRDEFNMFYDENDHQRPVAMVSILLSSAKLAHLGFFDISEILGLHSTIDDNRIIFKSGLSCLYNGR
jgi:hypothetical protein